MREGVREGGRKGVREGGREGGREEGSEGGKLCTYNQYSNIREHLRHAYLHDRKSSTALILGGSGVSIS